MVGRLTSDDGGKSDDGVGRRRCSQGRGRSEYTRKRVRGDVGTLCVESDRRDIRGQFLQRKEVHSSGVAD